MEVDIEISFSLNDSEIHSSNITKFENYYDIVNINKEKNIFLVSKEYDLKNITLSDAIINFFKQFEGVYNFKPNIEKLLRLGIYYDLEETVVFPVMLTNTCISLLSKINVSLDISGYPCSE